MVVVPMPYNGKHRLLKTLPAITGPLRCQRGRDGWQPLAVAGDGGQKNVGAKLQAVDGIGVLA
jgi:hypothetical protein